MDHEIILTSNLRRKGGIVYFQIACYQAQKRKSETRDPSISL